MQRKLGRKRKLERAGRNSIFDLNAKKLGKKEKIEEGREKFHIRSSHDLCFNECPSNVYERLNKVCS
jgi:hypothetical protein